MFIHFLHKTYANREVIERLYFFFVLLLFHFLWYLLFFEVLFSIKITCDITGLDIPFYLHISFLMLI